MSEPTAMNKEEFEKLRERARKLALDKSCLQLIIRLMNRVSEASGLENTIEALLRNIADVIGGTNILLYYRIDEKTFMSDLMGGRARLESIDDETVLSVMASREPLELESSFSDTRMTTPEFSKSYTWVYPLLVGVLKMENMSLSARDLYNELPVFFNFTALLIKNEILGLTKLKKAYDELRDAKERLELKLDTILNPEAEVTDQELGNIIDSATVQKMMEDFTRLTGMVTAIVDLRGTVLVATGWQDICTKFHRANPETARYCTESDLYLARNVKPGEYSAYRCRNGLWDIVTPLYIGGRHMGNIYTGQFFYDDETPDSGFFEKQAELYGFDKNEYMAALGRVPRIGRKTAETLMNFIVRFTEMISRLSYGKLSLAKTVLENKRIHEELNEANAGLEKKVSERTAELLEANERLKSELSERARIEEALRLTQFTVDNASDTIFWIRPDGSYFYANEAASRLLGYTVSELLRMRAYDVNPVHGDAAWHVHWAELSESRELRFEARLVKKDGSLVPVEISANLVEFGGHEYNCAFVRDITERKLAEDALNKLNDELERRVRERTAELEKKNAELARMNKLFVGRELKMIELKRRIEELESKMWTQEGPNG